MRVLDRYISKTFLQNLALSILGMTGLFLFQAMFVDLFSHEFPVRQTLYYHALNIPKIITEMAAPATLLATVLTLSVLNRTHELTACFGIGISLKRIVILFILVIIGLSGLILVAENNILPSCFKRRTAYHQREMRGRADFDMDIKKEKIWYRSRNMIYNLKNFDTASNTIHGISIYIFNENFTLNRVISAEKAVPATKGWRLIEGTVSTFPQDQNQIFPTIEVFSEKEVPIQESLKDFREIEKQAEGLTFKELIFYIKRLKTAGVDTKAYAVKLHFRISLCFIPIVMCLLGVPFSISSRREGGIARDLGLCLIITFFYWLFFSMGLSFGVKGVLSPSVAAWLPSCFFFPIAVVLIKKKL